MTTADIRTRLERGDRLLLDGAVGTELARRGSAGRPGIARSPQITQQVHESYLEAGADLLTTDTFTTNRYVLRKVGQPEERMAEYTRAAVTLARQTRDRLEPEALVAGSMSGPGFENIEDEYAEQAAVLAAAGADILLPEYTSFVNCAPAVRAASRTGLPVFLGIRHVTESGVLDTGHTIQDAIDSLDGCWPDAVLLMCSSATAISAALPALREAFSGGAVGAYANMLTEVLTPERYAELARRWVLESGAQIIGGCCGTRPEHIAALRDVLDELATA